MPASLEMHKLLRIVSGTFGFYFRCCRRRAKFLGAYIIIAAVLDGPSLQRKWFSQKIMVNKKISGSKQTFFKKFLQRKNTQQIKTQLNCS